MFFPIGDDQVQGGNKPLFVYSLIILNTITFLFEYSLDPESCEAFISQFGAIPNNLLNGKDYINLISCMFLHAGWMHLIGNMLFLWVFADNIETVIGTINFMVFYIFGGVIASMIHVFFNPYSEIPMIGASGAISSVLGAYLVMFPASRIKVFFLLFLSIFYVPSIFFLGFWIIQQLIAGFGAINSTALESSGVAWWAHIGGFSFGVIVGFIIRSQYKNRYKYISYSDEVEAN
ncbi:MAG: rhomboid family intramembrane serine protease [Saprospiraceae bacterium]